MERPYTGWAFLGLLTDGGGQKYPSPLNLSYISYNYERRSKIYMNHVKCPYVQLTSAFFHQQSTNFAISRNKNIDCILIYNF